MNKYLKGMTFIYNSNTQLETVCKYRCHAY